MIKLLCIFIFLSSLAVSAQEGNTFFTQKQWLERAKSYERSKDSTNAMVNYYYAYTEDPDTFKGKAALKKSNKYKTYFRNKILLEVQGVWKLITHGSNWGYTTIENDSIEKFVRIEGNNATFYQSNVATARHKILQEVKLNFVELQGDEYHMLEFRYANDEIWNYSVEGTVLSITEIGKAHGDFVSAIVCGNAEYYYSKVEN